ncbi:Uma2 family endonuclease [Kyrpidia sp.]|uniref:Uma2 family endonuclease n=1 Tax=Kyrpidia sp. TaxID=2073077 RepID=UPI002590A5E8|nr:Uma2 family endonuclease [Kyrpidia sp.]MCL6576122.1 Uma2 family endonuclease [Kyrpidia sp.]
MEANRIDESKFERWERIDGAIYDMSPPPTSDHQSIVSNLIREISVYLKGKTCKVFPAPFGVWLDADDNGNYVEPDITVVCDPTKIHRQGCVGVPDMIIEVLSPSTAVKDKTVKLRAYRVAGVREYWIVDSSNQIVEVYMLSENVLGAPIVYGKDETATVGIFPDLTIDLKDVFYF